LTICPRGNTEKRGEKNIFKRGKKTKLNLYKREHQKLLSNREISKDLQI
jgi:hypothetical protein